MGGSQVDDTNNWNWYGVADVDEPDSCHMVADEQIFEQVGQGIAGPTIRCYTWRRPAVTMGRLQDEQKVGQEFPNFPLYRRPTGGLAVQHGDDLTISVTAPKDLISRLLPSRKLLHIYMALVDPVRVALEKFYLQTQYGDSKVTSGATENGQDCFLTTARCDVIDRHGIKVLGSAMRRSSAATIVQMSLRPVVGTDVTGHDFTAELRSSYQRFIQSGL